MQFLESAQKELEKLGNDNNVIRKTKLVFSLPVFLHARLSAAAKSKRWPLF
jgi:hypothetical protein